MRGRIQPALRRFGVALIGSWAAVSSVGATAASAQNTAGATCAFEPQLTSELVGKPRVGQYSNVLVSVSEACAGGMLTVSAYPEADDALEVDEALSTKSFGMDSADAHQLTVTIRPSAEGRHYFNVLASGALGNGDTVDRVLSVGVDVGEQRQSDVKTLAASDAPAEGLVLHPMTKIENDGQ